MTANYKKVQRAFRELGPSVKRIRRRNMRRTSQPRPTLTAHQREPTLDFASEVTAGQRFRVLDVIDSFIRQCLVLETASSFPSCRDTHVLEQAIAEHGKPQTIRCDNHRELISRHVMAWAIEWEIDVIHIQLGKSIQNGDMESRATNV
jgi:putative transposase